MRRVGREQRVTLRLSRQRPGRVRPRERADESSPERKPRQWRDLTVLASLLAVLLTVPGTVWAVLVAQDQLNQSEETAVKEERAQASRVSAWTSQDPHGKWLVHVMNRSPDPIGQTYLTFEPLTVDAPQISWAVSLTGVPPCTDMTISQEQLKYREKDRRFEDMGEFAMPIVSPLPSGEGWLSLNRENMYMVLGGAAFIDRNGLKWSRIAGRLSPAQQQPVAPMPGLPGRVFGLPAYRVIQECGEGSEG
ncbi:hypothetical protein [Streptomyces sp. NPDC001893]|uniref:hypothetical protein n=1 Tax=Streptomyces sp. NPDC001893 TaxID=3154530 RepID=UPI00332CC9E1